MKKLSLLIAFTLLSIGWVFAQSLTLNYITFHGSDGVTDDVFSADETVHVLARYDAVTMQSLYGVYRSAGTTDTGQIYVLWYNGDPPTGSYSGATSVSISNFSYDGVSTDGYLEFDFTLPKPTSSAETFQLAFGIYGESAGIRYQVSSDRNTSYLATASTSVCPGDTSDGSGVISPEWETYGVLDSSTDPPTLSEPTNGSRDNQSIYIAFNLPEPAYTGSVKLYIDDDSNHTNGYFNELTLISGYEASGNHNFYLNGDDLDDDPYSGDTTTDVADVATPANSTLTDGTAYYFAIGYQDDTGNNVAFSSWASMTYDKTVTNPTAVSATDLSGDDIQVQYTLPEDTQDWEVTFCFDTDTNSGNGCTSEVVLANETNVGSQGARTVTFQGNSLSSSTYYDSHVGAGGLTTETSYYVGVSFTDQAGNASSITYSSQFTYTYDFQTTQATDVAADIEANATEGPVVDIDYNLPEAGATNGVYILVDDDTSHGTSGSETTSDVLYIIQVSGNYTAGAKNFNLSVPFVTADNGGDADNVLAISTLASSPYDLTDGDEYYVAVRYSDAESNPAVTSVWTSFTWDGVTDAPVWDGTQPTADNRAFSFVYTLPEIGETNSVRVYIDNDSDHGSIWTTLSITGNDGYNGNSFVVDADQLNDATAYSDATDDVSNTPSQSNLPQGSNYYYRIGYQDQYGNAYAYTDWMQIRYDSVTQTPNLDLPAASSTFTTDFTLQYDLPENAYEGSLYVMFTRTSGTADANSPHKLEIVSETAGTNIQLTNLDPTDLTAHAGIDNTPISGTGSLIDGAVYTIQIGYQDELLNPEATDSHTDCEYSSGAAVIEVTGRAVADVPLAGPSSTNQVVYAFDLNTTSGSADFSGVSFSRSGSAASTDFATNSFKIWLDDGDDVFEPAQDDDMSTGSDFSDWPGVAFSSLSFTGTTPVSIDATGETFFITCDQSATSDKLRTIRLAISSAGAVTSDADNTTGSFPMYGYTHSLDGYVIVEVDEAFYGEYDNTSLNNAPLFKFSLQTNQAATTVSQIIINFSGTGAEASSFSGSTPMKIWSSTDGTFNSATDTQAHAAIAYNDALTFNWSARALLDVDEAETWYFVTGDLDEFAEGLTLVGTMNDEGITSDYGIETDVSGNEDWENNSASSTLPVELSAFLISNTGRLVTIEWTTESESDNMGFNVYRGLSTESMAEESVIQLNNQIILGAGTSSAPTDYYFQDDFRIEYGVTYYYWLETIDMGNISSLFGPTTFIPTDDGGSDAPINTSYGLHANYPNPFNPSTTISFYLENTSKAKLDIFNARGQVVKNIFNGTAQANIEYRLEWDGRDDSGKSSGSGIYFYRLQHGNQTEMKKMILLR